MCIQTRIQKILAEKETLDAQIVRLEKLESATAPVKNLLAELLADYAKEAPEDLAAIWEEVLAIGQRHGLSVQPLVADELRQWEATQAENERLKQEAEKWSAAAAISELAVKDLRSQLAQIQPDRDEQMRLNLIFKLSNGNYDKSVLSESDTEEVVDYLVNHQADSKSEVWPKGEVATQLENLYQEALVKNTEAAVSESIPALTLWQPWATLIQQEVKRIETRSWATNYRGPIAIHAAKKSVYTGIIELLDLLQGDEEPPMGAVVAIANLIDCVEMTPEFIAEQTQVELKCGDWKPGRFAWILEIIRPVVPPIPASGGQKLWNWSGTSIAAELEYLEKLKAALEPEEATNSIDSILKAKGFFQPDDLEHYDSDDKHETYRGWDIYCGIPNGGVVAIGLYNSEYNQPWDSSTEYIQDIDPTFPESLGDFDKIITWTRELIDQVENLEVPGQLSLGFPEPTSEQTELQKLLANNSNFTFEELGVSIVIESVIAPADDTVDFESEEVRITATNATGKTLEYYVDGKTFVFHYPVDLLEQAALGYAQHFLRDLEKKAGIKEKIAQWKTDDAQPIAEESNTEPAKLETESSTQESKFKVGDRLNNKGEFATISVISKGDIYLVRDSGGSVCLPANELENFGWQPARTDSAEIEPVGIGALYLDPNVAFEAMGYDVRVYPQYAGENNLTGATFRFLNTEGRLVFDQSLVATELGDRDYKTCAGDLIQNYHDKEAARLEKLANPCKKPEDDFIELVKFALNPDVGYLKRKDNGEVLANYIAFANRDLMGKKTATFAKVRAKKWVEFLHSSFESCGWVVSEPRAVKRMQNQPGIRQFSYEVKITGASFGQIQKLAEENFSLLPNEEVAPIIPSVSPVQTAPQVYRVKVNSYELASGTEAEMRSRFEEELKILGGSQMSVSLLTGSEVIESYRVADFNFVQVEDFDSDNPEYDVTHLPLQKSFKVYKKLQEPGYPTNLSGWTNTAFPYTPGFTRRESAAADAVRRSLKAQNSAE